MKTFQPPDDPRVISFPRMWGEDLHRMSELSPVKTRTFSADGHWDLVIYRLEGDAGGCKGEHHALVAPLDVKVSLIELVRLKGAEREGEG